MSSTNSGNNTPAKTEDGNQNGTEYLNDPSGSDRGCSNIEMGYLHLDSCKVRILATNENNEPLPRDTWIDFEMPSTVLTRKQQYDASSDNQRTTGDTHHQQSFCCRCDLVLTTTSNQMDYQTEHREDDYLRHHGQDRLPRLQMCEGGRFDGTIKDVNAQRDTRPSSKPQQALSPFAPVCTCRKKRRKKRSDAALLMGLVLTCQDIGQIKVQSAKIKLQRLKERTSPQPTWERRHHPNSQSHHAASMARDSYYDVSILLTISFPHLLANNPSRVKNGRKRIASHSSKKLLPASTQLLLSMIRSDWERFDSILEPSPGSGRLSAVPARNNRRDPPAMFPSQLSLEEVFKRISAAGSFVVRGSHSTNIGSSSGEILSGPVGASYLLALPQDIIELKIATFLRAKSVESLRCTCSSLHYMLRSVVPGMKLQLYAHQINSLSWMRRREIRHLEENDFLVAAASDTNCAGSAVHGKLLPQDDGDAHRALTCGATVYLRERQHSQSHGTTLTSSTARIVRVAQDTGIEVDLPPDGALSRSVGHCGLLCDSPGLGKTISILSLILQTLGLSTGCLAKSSPEGDGSTILDCSLADERIFSEYWRENVVAEFRRPALNRLVSDLLRSDPESSYFLNPVDPAKDDCVDYFEVIKHPICFRDIRKKIQTDGYGGDFSSFSSDIELCFGNATQYNPPENVVHQAAQRMSAKFLAFVKDFKLRQIHTAQKSFAKASSKPNSSVAALIDARNRKKFLESLVATSSTLIVVPGVLMEHWQEQLKQHVDLRYCSQRTPIVFEYKGTTDCGLRMEEIVHQCKVKSTHFPFAFLDMSTTRKLPSPEFLSMFSIVLTTNQRFTNEWKNGSFEDELRRKSIEDDELDFRSSLQKSEESCPLLKINWLRMIVDEGHSMGRGSNSAIRFASWITAERRWAMTGTPTRQTATQSGLSNIHGLMGYLQHDFFSHRRDGISTWQNMVVRSWNAGYLASFFRTLSLLKLFMVRHTKRDIQELPPPEFCTTTIKMSGEEVTTYNTLVCAIQTNLILTSMEGKTSGAQDSLLHRSQAKFAKEALSNVRLVCVGGTRVIPTLTEKYWNEFFDILRQHNPSESKYQQVQQYIHRASTEQLSPCGCCGMMLSTLLVFPCGDLVCTECVDNKSTSCIVCEKGFDVDDFQRLQPGFDFKWLHNIEEEKKQKKQKKRISSQTTTNDTQGRTLGDPDSGIPVVLEGGAGNLAPRDPETPRRRTRKPGDGHVCEYDVKSPDGECVLCWKEHDSCNLMTKTGRCAICHRQAEACPQSESKSYYVIERLTGLHRSQVAREESRRFAGSPSSEAHWLGEAVALIEGERPLKVIIFSQFRKVLNLVGDRLLKRFGSAAVAEYWGKFRKQELHKFVYDKDCFCMLLGRDGSEGLDLSFVTHIVFLEQVWDKSLENQVVARAWRMGAKGAVKVETLIAETSVEATMQRLEGSMGSDKLEEVGVENSDDEGYNEANPDGSTDKRAEYRRAKLHYLLKGLQLIKNPYTWSFGMGTKRKAWSFSHAAPPVVGPKRPRVGHVRFQEPGMI